MYELWQIIKYIFQNTNRNKFMYITGMNNVWKLYEYCMTFVWIVILFNKKTFYNNVMPQKHRFNITTSLFLYRIIWTSLPIVSNLMASTACAFCLLELHICESLPPFKFGSSCCSFWTKRHQFRIWNITWYIPCTLARDRLTGMAYASLKFLRL